ncbi:MAG: site-2 protease family protein [Lentisphaeria bacterium]|nr:site-2 protease family protein [Lentisphaeria bacterium]
MDYEYLLNYILNILGIAGSVLFVVFFFGMCIFVHELGHFLVAKWRGLHVDAFSIGFKKVWAKKINGVEYRIGCLPLGGYVELPQVDTATETPKAADGTELPPAKPLDRLLTAAAGPVCNIIFGLLLGCIVWAVGIPQDTPKMRSVEVAGVEENSPEWIAGLREGDVITRINGKKFYSAWKDIVVEILTTIGEVDLEIERNGQVRNIKYLPKVNPKKMAVEKTAYPFFTPRIPIEFHPEKGSVSEKAGIKSGDQLLSINGLPCEHFLVVQQFINYYGDKPLKLEMRKKESREKYTVEVQPVDLPDELEFMTQYFTGVSLTPNLQIVGIMRDFPAERSGLLPGDIIKKFNDKEVKVFQEFADNVQANKDGKFKITVLRGDKLLTFETSAKAVRPRSIGVKFMLRDYPDPFQQFTGLIELTAKSIRSMAVRLGYALGITEKQSNLSARNMSGPMGMAVVLYRSVRLSPAMGIYFVVMISFALAIFNLLPLPVLDGGHVFMSLIEIIFRRPLPVMFVRVLSYIFIGLLILLMLYVTYMDVLRVVPGAHKLEQKLINSGETEEVAEKNTAPAPTSAPAPGKVKK